MANITFGNYQYLHTSLDGGVFFGDWIVTDPTTSKIFSLSADGIEPSLGNYAQLNDGGALYLLHIIDDTCIPELTISDKTGSNNEYHIPILKTNRASGIVTKHYHTNGSGGANRYSFWYWDANSLPAGTTEFNYTLDNKEHMTGYGSKSSTREETTASVFHDVFQEPTYHYGARNYDNTADILNPEELFISPDIWSALFEGNGAENYFDVDNSYVDPGPLPVCNLNSGFGLDVAHAERRRMWVLGYNVRNV